MPSTRTTVTALAATVAAGTLVASVVAWQAGGDSGTAATTASGSTATTTATAAWRAMSGPAPTRAGTLSRVDAVGAKLAWTIGTETGTGKTTIWVWKGTTWARQSVPLGFTPTGIAGADAKRAWATGFDTLGRSVALYWNGAKWARVTYPGIGVPHALSASADGGAWSIIGIDASGGGPTTLLRWNGRSFAKVAISLPPSSSLTTVGARTKSDVWVGGTYSDGLAVYPLAMHWNGKSWKQVKVPGTWGTPSQRNVMQRIVPVTASRVWAIRSQGAGSLLLWNGTKWTETAMPLGVQPYSLAEDGSGGAWVIPVPTGQTRSRFYHRTGGTWVTKYGPARNAVTTLNDISRIPGGGNVLGVGAVQRGNEQIPIIERYR